MFMPVYNFEPNKLDEFIFTFGYGITNREVSDQLHPSSGQFLKI